MDPNQPPPGYPVVFNQPEPGALLSFDPYAKPFRFDGGAGSYLGVSILAAILTIFTLGIAYPWAVCMRYRWNLSTRWSLDGASTSPAQGLDFSETGSSGFSCASSRSASTVSGSRRG